jgi:carbamoyltransferase
LIKRFYDRTQCPMLVNTSFNIRGEPIVCTPEDALRCFLGTDMDALVLENTLLLKDEQTRTAAADVAAYKRSFALD